MERCKIVKNARNSDTDYSQGFKSDAMKCCLALTFPCPAKHIFDLPMPEKKEKEQAVKSLKKTFG